MTYPIIPPRELTEQWASEWPDSATIRKRYDERDWLYEFHIADRAAQWGADQELEACCEWLVKQGWFSADEHEAIEELRAARRPKPPSLKERLSKAIVEGDEREALKLLEQLDG